MKKFFNILFWILSSIAMGLVSAAAVYCLVIIAAGGLAMIVFAAILPFALIVLVAAIFIFIASIIFAAITKHKPLKIANIIFFVLTLALVFAIAIILFALAS